MKKLTHVVQMGWFNHQQRKTYATFLVVWLGGEISPPVYTFFFWVVSRMLDVGCFFSCGLRYFWVAKMGYDLNPRLGTWWFLTEILNWIQAVGCFYPRFVVSRLVGLYIYIYVPILKDPKWGIKIQVGFGFSQLDHQAALSSDKNSAPKFPPKMPVTWLFGCTQKNICSTTFLSKGSHINKKIQSALKKKHIMFYSGTETSRVFFGYVKNRFGCFQK